MMTDASVTAFYGHSANASFVHLLRVIMQTALGASSFTNDPSRNDIWVPRLSDSISSKYPYQLPDREISRILINSFFAQVSFECHKIWVLGVKTDDRQTSGLCQIYEEDNFRRAIDRYYDDPSSADSASLSQFFLVLAIGLQLANPVPDDTGAIAVVENLRQTNADQSQIYFGTAKHIYDPSKEPEGTDCRSVQIMASITLFLMGHSMLDAAFIQCGTS